MIYQLIIEKNGKKMNLASDTNLEKLKDRAKRHNKKGCNVKIIKIETVFEITQN